MRLLFVNYEYPPIGGGAGTYTREIAHLLVEQHGHEVLIITSCFGDLPTREEPIPGIVVRRIPVRRRKPGLCTHAEMASFIFASLRAGRPILAEEGACSGAVGFLSLPSGVLPWHLRRLAGIPYGILLLGGDVPGFRASRFMSLLHLFAGPLNRAIWRKAVFMAANSTGLRVLALQACPDVAIGLLPTGVDVSRFRYVDRAARGAPLRLLFLGRLSYQKGPDVLLRACAILSRIAPGLQWTATIAGEGPLRPHLDGLARDAGISDRVDFLGFIHPDRLPELYARHDLLVQPSRDEGMSCVILEAMATGLSVVATQCRGTTEQVASGETGLLVPVEDPEALAGAIHLAAENATTRETWGVASRRRAEEMSWSRTAEGLAELVRVGFGESHAS